jgi:transcriptional regulator with XRE-family HTH domain
MEETLSEYVERIMRQKGLNLSDIERNCDKKITGSYVGKVLKGTVTNLTVEKIIALAQGLDVDPYEVFAVSYGEPPKDRAQPDPLVLINVMQKLLANPELVEDVQEWMELSAEQRSVLKQAVKRVKKPKGKRKKKR